VYHPLVAATVWTPIRKMMGNIVPAFFWLPLAVYGVYIMFASHRIVTAGTWSLVGATVLGWIGLNLFGLFQNGVMRRRLARILNEDEDLPKDHAFVGFTTPKYSGLLDAHEDVGFLCFTPTALLFVGEARTVEMPRECVRGVVYRPNVHSLVGLGRWISVEGEASHHPVRMLFEPRERPTMLGNLLYGPRLRKKIEAWIGGSDQSNSQP
jgi:hypothetical protein